MSAPLVTVGIPTFNRSAQLAGALASVTAQTYRPLEIVVSDNASPDDTKAVVAKWAAKHPEIRYVALPENRGPLANFMNVLDEAHGDYFMWLGDDDSLDPDYIERCMATHAEHPGSSLVAGVPVYYKAEREQFRGQPMNLVDRDPRARVLEYYRTVEHNGVFYGLAPTRRLRSTPFRHTLGGDWLLVAGLAFQGPVRTVTGTHVHRENTWNPSTGHDRIVTQLGLPRWHGRFPLLAIALAAANEIVTGDVFRSLSRPKRWQLALRAGQTLAVRSPLPGPARRLMQLGRRRKVA